jgi:hypothetical protein
MRERRVTEDRGATPTSPGEAGDIDMTANTQPPTATQLDVFTTAVALLDDHGYAVTSAAVSVDTTADAASEATITISLAEPTLGAGESDRDSAGTETPDPDPGTVPVDGGARRGSEVDSGDAPPKREATAVTVGTAAPLQIREDPGNGEGASTRSADSSESARDAAAGGSTDDGRTGDPGGDGPSMGPGADAGDEYWCEKCGYGPGTKRAIAIHNGHQHGSDAEYAATEPAPEDDPEAGSTHPAPDEPDDADDADGGAPAGEAPTNSSPDDVRAETADSLHDRPRRTKSGGGGRSEADGSKGEGDVPESDGEGEPAEAELPDLGFPIPERITADAVREAVDGAKSVEDVQASLKWPAGQCRLLLEAMGLGTDLLEPAPKTGHSLRSKRTV